MKNNNPRSIDDMLNWAVHNLELEGYTVPDEAKAIYRLVLEQKISSQEAIEKLSKLKFKE